MNTENQQIRLETAERLRTATKEMNKCLKVCSEHEMQLSFNFNEFFKGTTPTDPNATIEPVQVSRVFTGKKRYLEIDIVGISHMEEY